MHIAENQRKSRENISILPLLLIFHFCNITIQGIRHFSAQANILKQHSQQYKHQHTTGSLLDWGYWGKRGAGLEIIGNLRLNHLSVPICIYIDYIPRIEEHSRIHSKVCVYVSADSCSGIRGNAYGMFYLNSCICSYVSRKRFGKLT